MIANERSAAEDLRKAYLVAQEARQLEYERALRAEAAIRRFLTIDTRATIEARAILQEVIRRG